MATGRSMQLTKQVGEHLVAAELARRGFVVTTFAGNVPDFDLVAIDSQGKSVLIQVKAIQGPSWQLNARTYLKIRLDKDVQRFEALAAASSPGIVNVFVKVGNIRECDEFYVLRWDELQQHVKDSYFREGWERSRPKNPRSFHTAIWPKDLAPYRDRWDAF